MGTHPSAPSVLAADPATPLAAWLASHPAAVGVATASHFDGATDRLPFLFKVLAVRTALSIQSHPDKELAGRLRAGKPELYPDANHKPEMAIAVGHDFTALCGFAPVGDIVAALQSTPELARVVGERPVADLSAAAAKNDADAAKPSLRAAFTALMTAEEGAYGGAVDELVARLTQAKEEGKNLVDHDTLALTLASQYPRDVGVLASYFLNYVRLQDGQALALAANEPHAYVSGTLVECMAASDNVIRAGLTPKPRDTDALCASLTYGSGVPVLTPGVPVQEYVTRYAPPFDEFEVQRLALPSSPASPSTLLPPFPGPSILLVTGGAGSLTATATPLAGVDGLEAERSVSRGDVIFLPAATPLSASGAGLTAWIATVNGRVFGADDTLYPPAGVPAVVAAGAE